MYSYNSIYLNNEAGAMNERNQLEAKGYSVNTKDLAVHWLCTLEWHGRVESLFGATETEAIKRAALYVGELERNYELQQQRIRCEGCGE